jgi:hypothetical protein
MTWDRQRFRARIGRHRTALFREEQLQIPPPGQVSWLSGVRRSERLRSAFPVRALSRAASSSGFVLRILPDHSGATAADSHGLPSKPRSP